MKTKNKKNTNKEKSGQVLAIQINVVIAIIVLVVVFLIVWSSSSSFTEALHDVLHKIWVCLQHKADHILEIVVIIILVSIRGIANRFVE